MNKQGYTTQKENKGEGACSKIKNKASTHTKKNYNVFKEIKIYTVLKINYLQCNNGSSNK
jgi:hypothetical protein